MKCICTFRTIICDAFMGDDLGTLRFLLEHVPLRLTRHNESSAKTNEEMSAYIARRMRFITNMNRSFFLNKFYPKLQDHTKDDIEESDITDPFTMFSPLETQSFSFLLEFVYGSLNKIAESFHGIARLSIFPHIAFNVVPSLFGHFSNEYFCQKASLFYTQLLSVINVEQFQQVVALFFNIPSILPFTKSIFNLIFLKNYQRRIPVDSYGRAIMQSIKPNLHLLPETHIQILREMIKKWSQSDIYKFIINIILIPQIKILKVYHCIDIHFSISILNDVLQRLDVPSPITLNDLSIAQGVLFPNHGNNIKLIITLYEIRGVLFLPLIYPAHLQNIIDLLNKPNLQINVPFLVKLQVPIPRNPSPKLFFEEVDVCQSPKIWEQMKKSLPNPIEYLLNEKSQYKEAIVYEIYQLRKQGLQFEQLLSKFQLSSDLKSSIVKLDDYYNKLSLYSTVAFGKSGFWKSLLELSEAENQFKISSREPLIQCECLFGKLIENMRNKGFERLNRTVRRKLTSTTSILIGIEHDAPLLHRFMALTEFLQDIESAAICIAGSPESPWVILDSEGKAMRAVITAANPLWIISTTSFLQKHGFGDHNFCDACPEILLERWRRFTISFLNMLSEDPTLLSLYTPIAFTIH